MKYLLFIMTLILYPMHAHSAEYKPCQSMIRSNTSTPWTLCATLAGVAIGIGLKSCYDKLFNNNTGDQNRAVIPAIPIKTIDREALQRKLTIDITKLAKAREIFNSSEIAIKRANLHGYYADLQRLAKNSSIFCEHDFTNSDDLSLTDIQRVEGFIKAKINEIYSSNKEKLPEYDTDDQIRKTHLALDKLDPYLRQNARTKSLTGRAGIESQGHWQHLNELQYMRITYTDLVGEIEKAEIKVKSLEVKVENLNAELAST